MMVRGFSLALRTPPPCPHLCLFPPGRTHRGPPAPRHVDVYRHNVTDWISRALSGSIWKTGSGAVILESARRRTLLLQHLLLLLLLLSPPSPLKAERQEERVLLLEWVCVCARVCMLPCDPRHLWLFYFGGGNRKRDEQRCRLVPFSRQRSGFHAAAPTHGANLANKRHRYKGAAGGRSDNKTSHQKYTNQQLVPQPVKLEINTFETRIDANINSVRMLMQRQTSASKTHSGRESFPRRFIPVK